MAFGVCRVQGYGGRKDQKREKRKHPQPPEEPVQQVHVALHVKPAPHGAGGGAVPWQMHGKFFLKVA